MGPEVEVWTEVKAWIETETEKSQKWDEARPRGTVLHINLCFFYEQKRSLAGCVHVEQEEESPNSLEIVVHKES